MLESNNGVPNTITTFSKYFLSYWTGLINKKKLLIIEDAEKQLPGYSKDLLPIIWAASIVTETKEEGMIKQDLSVKTLLDKLNEFRGWSGALMLYYTIIVPLEYTQVVTNTIYSYFLMSLKVTVIAKDCMFL